MDALVIFLIFFAIAIAGWMIAEVKMKVDNYNLSEDEKAAMTAFLDNQRKGGYEEMNIRDVVKNISTKGFLAV